LPQLPASKTVAVLADNGCEAVWLIKGSRARRSSGRAQIAFASAEARRARLHALPVRHSDFCKEYDAIQEALFTQGDRSKRMNEMYNQYRQMLLFHHHPQA
jgi:hypothetical protein